MSQTKFPHGIDTESGNLSCSGTVDFSSATVKGAPFCIAFTQQGAGSAGDDISWKWKAPFAMTITEVAVAAAAVTTTASVDVEEGSTSILSSAIAVQTTAQVATPDDGGIADNAEITVSLTTNSTGTTTDLCVVLTGERA